MATDNWGARARFGIFIVGAEAVPEAEWWAMVPNGVSVHAARVSAPTPWATWTEARDDVVLAPDLERGAAQFAAMRLASVVVAHSSSSLVGGSGWDAAIVARLSGALHPTTNVGTNGQDCISAMLHCGIERPFLVFPPWFGDAAVSAGLAYCAAHGFTQATAFRHVPAPQWKDTAPSGLYDAFMHLAQNADLLFDQICEHCPPGADGVLIFGTGFRCVGIIDRLEESLDRPVITANQASLWRCLNAAGVGEPIAGYGRLLARSG